MTPSLEAIKDGPQVEHSGRIATPIDRLPLELLHDIFWRVLVWNPNEILPIDSSEYYRGLNPLRLVSSYWSLGIDNNELFWSVAASEAPPPNFAKILQKSGQSPLYVSYSKKSGKECLEMLVKESYRWRTLLLVTTTEEHARVLLAQRAPLLKTIHARLDFLPLVADLETPLAAKVDHFSLMGASIPWTGMFHEWDLRTLRLTNISWIGPPTVNEFLGVLDNCPNLIDLSVDNAIIIETDMGIRRTIPVRLPCLKSLFLRRVPHQAVYIMLDEIVIPRDALVILHNQGTDESLDDLIPYIAHRLTTMGERVKILDFEFQEPIAVCLDGRRSLFTFLPKLSVVFPDDPPEDADERGTDDTHEVLSPQFHSCCLYMLRKLKPKEYPACLVVGSMEADHIAELLPELDRCFPDANSIILACSPPTGELLNSLTHILLKQPGSDTWYFPKLGCLFLETKAESCDCIVDVIKGRVEASQNESSGITKLHSITLKGGRISRTAIQALRGLGVTVMPMTAEIDV